MSAPARGEPTRSRTALRRFNGAVEALEAAIERRLEVERQEAALAAAAATCSAPTARASPTRSTMPRRAPGGWRAPIEEVARRLGSAMETIRAVLAAHER